MRRCTYLLGIVISALLLPQRSDAQSVSGVVVSDGGLPAVNARVWLTSTRGIIADTARSDAQGRFTLNARRAGRYVLNVRRLGYFPEESDPIRLASGEVRYDTVHVLGARVLQPVDVVVRREVNHRFGVDIRSLSSSNVITPEEIDRVRPAASTLEDLVRWNAPPSLMMRRQINGSMCYQLRVRGCAPVYVDGMLWGTDAWIPASDIESIVIIPDTEAFIRFGSNNGVIAVFTNVWGGR